MFSTANISIRAYNENANVLMFSRYDVYGLPKL